MSFKKETNRKIQKLSDEVAELRQRLYKVCPHSCVEFYCTDNMSHIKYYTCQACQTTMPEKDVCKGTIVCQPECHVKK